MAYNITLGMLRIMLTVDITRGDSMAIIRMDVEWVPDIEKDGARTTLNNYYTREAEDREGRRRTSPRVRMHIALHVLYMYLCLAGWCVFKYIPRSLC